MTLPIVPAVPWSGELGVSPGHKVRWDNQGNGLICTSYIIHRMPRAGRGGASNRRHAVYGLERYQGNGEDSPQGSDDAASPQPTLASLPSCESLAQLTTTTTTTTVTKKSFQAVKARQIHNEILISWFLEHIEHPYPTKAQKRELCVVAHMTPVQLRNWFTNMRKRHWSPMREGREPRSYIEYVLFKRLTEAKRRTLEYSDKA